MFNRILLVDDDKEIIETMEEVLTDFDLEILKAGNGLEAIDIIRAKKPDVVVTDMKMPGLGGWEIFEMSRKLSSSPTFIFITGYGTIPDARDSIKKGVFDYLEKPFSMEKLRTTVRNSLEYQRISRENRYLKSRLADWQPEASENEAPIPYLDNSREILDYALDFTQDDTQKDILRKLLKAVVEITLSSSGSIYLYDLSLKRMRFNFEEAYRAEAGAPEKADSENATEICYVAPPRAGDGDIQQTCMDDPSSQQNSQGWLRISQRCLTLSIESPYKVWGVIYLGGKASGAAYGRDDIANVTVLVKNAIERLTALDYRQEAAPFMDDSKNLGEASQNLKTAQNQADSSQTLSLLLDAEFRIAAVNGAIRELWSDEGSPISSFLFDIPFFKSIEEELKHKFAEVSKSGRAFVYDRLLPIKSSLGFKQIEMRLLPMADFMKDKGCAHYILLEDVTAREIINRKASKLGSIAIFNRFMAGIAHDLNNPLDGLGRLIKILEGKYKDISNAEIFDRMHLAVQRMSSKIQTCFQNAKNDVHKHDMQPIGKLLDDALGIMSPLLAERGIKVVKDIRTDKVGAWAPADFCDIFLNIIRNSCEAINNDGALEIRIEDNKTRNGVDLVFKDSGCGFPADFASCLGAPFFTTKEHGLGLGLALCEKMIDSYGGTMSFRNGEESGAEVSIFLPV